MFQRTIFGGKCWKKVEDPKGHGAGRDRLVRLCEIRVVKRGKVKKLNVVFKTVRIQM